MVANQNLHRMLRWMGASARAAALVGALATSGNAATFTVNSRADVMDETPGDGLCQTAGGVCTLRAAIEEANALSGADAVNVPAASFGLTEGQLVISSDLTINGAGIGSTTVDGNLKSRVILISNASPIVVSISNLTVQHGHAGSGETEGGGIKNESAVPLTLTNVRIRHNRVRGEGSLSSYGGGLFNAATAHLNNVIVKGNQAYSDADEGNGGGIFNDVFGTMSITNSQIVSNRISCAGLLDSYGGGIENLGNLTLTGVVIERNRIDARTDDCWGYGGGLDSGSGVSVLNGSNVTVSRNSVLARRETGAEGGGIYIGDTLATLTGVTVKRNSAIARKGHASGGGITVGPGATLDIADAEVLQNRIVGADTADGAGIYVDGNGTLDLLGGLVSRNKAKGERSDTLPCGGGITISPPSGMATIEDVVVSLNRVIGVDAADGGICGSATLTNVTLSSNSP